MHLNTDLHLMPKKTVTGAVPPFLHTSSGLYGNIFTLFAFILQISKLLHFIHAYKMLVNHPLNRDPSGLSCTYIHVSAAELLSSPSSRHLHKVERTTNLLLKVRQRLQNYSVIQTRLWVFLWYKKYLRVLRVKELSGRPT